MNRFGVLLLAVVACLHSCKAPTSAPMHEQPASLIGAWTVVSGVWGSNEYVEGNSLDHAGVPTPRSWTWTFTPDQYSWKVETDGGMQVGRLLASAYRLNATKQPMELDLAISSEAEFDDFMACIYTIEGETLTLVRGSPRPSSFVEGVDQHLVLIRK